MILGVILPTLTCVYVEYTTKSSEQRYYQILVNTKACFLVCIESRSKDHRQPEHFCVYAFKYLLSDSEYLG